MKGSADLAVSENPQKILEQRVLSEPTGLETDSAI